MKVINVRLGHNLLTSSIVLLGTALAASAGQIQIGGSDGLTRSYVTNGGTAAGNTGGATEANYDVNLFANASDGSTNPKPYATYSTNAASDGTITDTNSGIIFNMIDDGLDSGGNSSNFWMLSASGNPTMTIPIGIFGATSVWTLINSMDANATGTRDENITFVFGTTATGGTLTDVGLKLTNAGNLGSAGEVRNAVSCSSPGCSGLSNGNTLSSTALSSAVGTPGLPIDVFTDPVYTSVYNSATGVYAGTTGSVGLEDQGFIFTGSTLAIAQSEYLVAVQIKEPSVSNSDLAISAITVDPNDVAPEPSSALLLLLGVGALGLGQRLKKISARM